MEVWEVIGLEFKARFKGDDGTVVSGVRLHLAGDPDPGADFSGKQVRNQFISDQAMSKHQIQVKVGDTIVFHFNRFGNICKVEVS